MAAPKGNTYWKRAEGIGRNRIFVSPEHLRAECTGFLEWLSENPDHDTRAMSVGGKVEMVNVPKHRAPTIAGLCLYLGIGQQTWRDYRKRKEFSEVIEEIEEILWVRKFELAAAGILNANIISRDLGLMDRQSIEDGRESVWIIEHATAEEARSCCQHDPAGGSVRVGRDTGETFQKNAFGVVVPIDRTAVKSSMTISIRDFSDIEDEDIEEQEA